MQERVAGRLLLHLSFAPESRIYSPTLAAGTETFVPRSAIGSGTRSGEDFLQNGVPQNRCLRAISGYVADLERSNCADNGFLETALSDVIDTDVDPNEAEDSREVLDRLVYS